MIMQPQRSILHYLYFEHKTFQLANLIFFSLDLLLIIHMTLSQTNLKKNYVDCLLNIEKTTQKIENNYLQHMMLGFENICM
jgi:hypothetical protein